MLMYYSESDVQLVLILLCFVSESKRTSEWNSDEAHLVTGNIITVHCKLFGWRFSLVVTHWSRST